ncbi:putative peroxiredoxin/glutaredoxin family protein [Anaeromyces robustus]|uniref:Putative peroxiredoxin/glutaredoxin family protein n=1 Tax=Anaeromyces robustus TaxID=1754192 RepID=A0A1Y1WQ94_9FUNG|nr:putative peroxiredoxin/glutaredoxin family protein [Anaeromyces robustus]|eukprot:ORX75555.1 putative peroxiredoxin/glutaredoxin family protein [Anaeromyces robustus]
MYNFPNVEGQKVPIVSWVYRFNGQWAKITSDEIFKNRKVVIFSLPGAFTPVCSSSHLPRYEELAETIKRAANIDDIYCISVNDPFVMDAWAKDQGIKNVKFIPDGNGEFTEKLGYLVDKKEFGLGMRSWRYSMYVENGIIKKFFCEPYKKDEDTYGISDADTMLDYLKPNTERPKLCTIITRVGCPYCEKAKELLQSKGIYYEELSIPNLVLTSRTLRAINGATSAPQVFIDGKLIGGYEDLKKYFSVSA